MKKALAVLLALMMGAALLAACSQPPPASGSVPDPVAAATSTPAASSGAAGSGDAVRVLLAGWDLEDGINPQTGEPFKGIKTWFDENFTPDHPDIEVELNIVPWDMAQQKQQAELMSESVDVLYTGSYVSQFYSMGLVREIDDLLAADTDYDPLELFPEGIWNTSYNLLTFDKSARYALPAVMGQRYTIYDKQLFDEWGVEYLSEYPTTEEILTKAAQMTGINPVTGEENYGIWFDTAMPIDVFTFVAWSYAYGVDGGTGTIADPKNIEWNLNGADSVQLWTDFLKLAEYTPPGFITGTGNEYFGFEDNNVAIYLDHNGAKIMGDYFANGENPLMDRFEPAMNVGPGGIGWVAVDPIIMAKNPRNLEASWEVMKALASPERQQYHYENFRWTPAVKDASFIDPADKYTPYALKIADSAKFTLIDEALAFYTVEIVPLVNLLEGNVLEGKTVNIQAELDTLQKKAEDWSAAQ